MIIADPHRFAFVHIPKCAGVSVKRPLRAIDSTDGYFSRIGDHPDLGRIHFAHITLDDLAAHFPDTYDKVAAYRSFAVVRDPHARFLSAIFQRLREFKHLNQSDLTDRRVEEEAGEVIAYLEKAQGRLDLEHVHFNRQIDYLFREDQQVVRDIFAIERMPAVVTYIAEHTEIAIEEAEKRNQSTEIRSSLLKPVIRAARKPYGMLVPYAVRNWLRARMERAGLYGRVRREAFIRPGGRVEGFIRSYYARDIELHAASL
jgi:hypothetical protein